MSSRIVRWQVLLAEYDIIYKTRKFMKESAIVDHLDDNAFEDYKPLNFDFPNEDVLVAEKEEESEWQTMYFDGAITISGNGAGAIIISPQGKQYPIAIKLQFNCTNNTIEYNTYIHRLEVVLEMKIRKLEVYGDSMLIMCQVKGECHTRDEKLKPYQEYLSKLAKDFDEIELTHLRRDKNQFCDTLATLAFCGYKFFFIFYQNVNILKSKVTMLRISKYINIYK